MDIYEQFLELLDKAIQEYGNANKLAERIGVHPNLISRWKNRQRCPSLASIQPIMDLLGAKLDVPTIRRIGENAPVEMITGSDLRNLPVYAVAGAGPAMSVDFLEPLFTVTAPSEYFYKADFAVKVEGHSMEPLIPCGAVVGVKKDFTFLANELYLANIPYEGLVVKRVGVNMETREFIFKSNNADKVAYPDFTVPIDDSSKIIIAKVVWLMIGY